MQLGFKLLAHQRVRDLALVRESGGSPRFFDIALRAERAKAAHAPLLFQTAPLNRVILIKHTLRAREREELVTKRRTATKLVFPIDLQDLSLGGYSLFVEETGFDRLLSRFLGDASGVRGLPEDLERLKLIAGAPMFDPFLLRERFRMSGQKADESWFALHPAREKKLNETVFDHIRAMFLGATGDPHLAEKFAEGFCYKIFTDEFADYADRLTAFFGMEAGETVEALFAWKAVLYHRMAFKELQGRIVSELNLLLGASCLEDAAPDERDYMLKVQNRLRRTVRRCYKTAWLALARYNAAYAEFTEGQRPAAFLDFLRDSPKIALTLGENIALMMHYGGLLTFRIEREAGLHTVGSAIELHQDLAASLDGDDIRREEPDIAAV